jgi:organic radical activating enzyme
MPSLSQSDLSLKLPVMEDFHTIQGEGAFTGSAAYFIRLGGCDVGCVWCDVKESWDADVHPKREIDDLVRSAVESGAKMAVITGGEPAMHELNELTKRLREVGLRTHIETSGTHPITGDWHWICFSPKKFKAPLEAVYELADELKVVVYNKHDLEWAETHAAKVRKECQLFLQPEWDRSEVVMPLIIDYVKAHPQWRISLQTHKFMNIP